MAYRLPDPGRKARYVRDKFDEIASRYDLFNDLITQGQHRRWKNVLVGRLGLTPGARGVDLCCGTGDIAARILAAQDGSGGVVAVDFSPNMLRIARGRLSRNGGGGPGPVVLRGDAMRLPFADESVEFVTIGYGLRNVSDLDACLGEIHRVLAPGGVMGSLDVGRVASPWVRPFSNFYMFRVVPLVGKLLQPGQEMYSYLPHSTRDYPGQEELAERMRGQGFQEVEILPFLFGASVIHLARKGGRRSA